MRKAFVLLVVSMTLVLALGPLASVPSGVRAQVPPPRLILTVTAGVNESLDFDPSSILIPQVPIVLNITVVNGGNTPHTFSIQDNAGKLPIDVVVTNRGDRATVEFQVNASSSGAIGTVFYNGTAFTPQRTDGGIRFYCRPHETLGMIGAIALATAGGEGVEERGLFLRAYWIGVIALAAMLLWTGITYFVIKTSSRHFTDHREHIRRGLP